VKGKIELHGKKLLRFFSGTLCTKLSLAVKLSQHTNLNNEKDGNDMKMHLPNDKAQFLIIIPT